MAWEVVDGCMQGGEKRMKKCPYCGAWLDACEPCDCPESGQKETAPSGRNAESGGADTKANQTQGEYITEGKDLSR